MDNTFDYVPFDDQYKILAKLVGGEETDPSTINGVVVNSNSIISNGLDYAADSVWANSKLEEWNALVPELKSQLLNLSTMLTNAKNAADKYHEWELSQVKHD